MERKESKEKKMDANESMYMNMKHQDGASQYLSNFTE